MKRHWNHLVWLLPLLTGIAAYALRPVDPGFAAQPRQKDARSERSLSLPEARAALEAVPARFEEEKTQHAARLPTLTTGEIQLRLQLLTGQRAAIGVWSERGMELRQEQLDLLASLARREGAAGAVWIQENLPVLRHLFIAAWGDQDAHAALEFVIRSDFPRPCAMSTLMKLLDRQADAGGVALNNAINRMPWYLFDPSNRDEAESPEFMLHSCGLWYLKVFDFAPGSDETKRVWLESGAARAVAEHGIPCDEALRDWFELDPSRALEEWSTWPRPSLDENSSSDFRAMIDNPLSTPEEIESLRDIFRRVDPATAGKIRQALEELRGGDPPPHGVLMQFTGEDFSPSPEPAEE